MAAVTGSVGIAALEDGEVLATFSEARMRFENNWHTPGNAVAGMLYLIARYTQLIGLLVIVFVLLGPWIALAMAAGVMVLRTGNRGGLRAYSRLWRDNGHLRRRYRYFLDVSMGSTASKEIRVFGSMPWLTKGHAKAHSEFADPIDRERRRIYFKPYLVYTAIAFVAVLWSLVSLTTQAAGSGSSEGELASGVMTLTAFTLGLQALIGALMLARDYPESDTSTQFGMNALSAIRDVEKAVREADTAPRGHLDVPAGAPPALDRVPRPLLLVPRRRRDGVFGAQPDARGRQDHRDRRRQRRGQDHPHEAARAALRAHLRWRSTSTASTSRTSSSRSGGARCPWCSKTLSATSSPRRTTSRWERRSRVPTAPPSRRRPHKTGMLETLSDAPLGLDTILARAYEDGIDLSGGQWQRVAIARSLYAVDKGARVLVLDEPTAALDVRAEAEFFDQFVELTEGLTTVLISHRFSSVRRADTIVVVEEGHVVEAGSHDELMANDSRYRRLFELQARRFREGLDADDDADAAMMGGV